MKHIYRVVQILGICLLLGSCVPIGFPLAPLDQVEEGAEREQDAEIIMEEEEITRSDLDPEVLMEVEDIHLSENDLPPEEPSITGEEDYTGPPIIPESRSIQLNMHIAGVYAGQAPINDILEYQAEAKLLTISGSELKAVAKGEYLQNMEMNKCKRESSVIIHYHISGQFTEDCKLEMLFAPEIDTDQCYTDRVCSDSSQNFSGKLPPTTYLYFPVDEMVVMEFEEGIPAVTSGEKVIGGETLPYHWNWKVEMVADDSVHFKVPVETSTGETIQCSVWVPEESDPVE